MQISFAIPLLVLRTILIIVLDLLIFEILALWQGTGISSSINEGMQVPFTSDILFPVERYKKLVWICMCVCVHTYKINMNVYSLSLSIFPLPALPLSLS